MALLQKAYLGATPLFRNTAWFEDDALAVVNSVGNTTVTADATAHTKGAWTQLISSTTANASFMVALVSVGANATNTATLIDFAIGASGSEVAFASNIAIGGASGNYFFGFPIKIPSGSRISARTQSVVASRVTNMQIATAAAGDYTTAPTSVDVIGPDTATSQGGSFSGASGTWVQATASTSQAYRGVALIASSHTNDSGIFVATYEVGVGASGSEVSFGGTRINIVNNEQLNLLPPYTFLFGRSIPSGSRLAIRHNISANPDRYGYTLIGIP